MSALANKALYQILSNPRHPCIEDIVAVGGELDADILGFAYQNGVFPWPHEQYPMLWFAPEQRGVIDFTERRAPSRFLKWLRQQKIGTDHATYEIKINQNFGEVVRQCRLQERRGQFGSWINDEIERAYGELFLQGAAFSCEVHRNGRLVGGIYGVKSSRYYSCESMFHLEDNTSKLALWSWLDILQTQGEKWVDIQMVTSVSESFGGKLISKEEFLSRIGL